MSAMLEREIGLLQATAATGAFKVIKQGLDQGNLDALLVSTIGLADIGTDVIGGNRQGLADLVHLLVPTLDLTERYHQSINCGLAGLLPLALSPPLDKPGIVDSIAFQYGRERYRYPSNLPKVAATGGSMGPQGFVCSSCLAGAKATAEDKTFNLIGHVLDALEAK